MTEAQKQYAWRVLKDVGAVITDSHIVYTSGKHGSAYINKDALYPHTSKTSTLCDQIAQKFMDENVQVVVAPAVGAIILSHLTAHHLTRYTPGKSGQVLAVYADKADGNEFVIKRGYDKLVRDKRVLVVEDILNTGGSAKRVVEAVRRVDGKVIGLGVLCNRGGVEAKDVGDVPRLEALINIDLKTWSEEECPLCKSGVPINTNVGHGKEFLEQKERRRRFSPTAALGLSPEL